MDSKQHAFLYSCSTCCLFLLQDALLLQVSTVYVKAESKGEQVLKTVLAGLFKFQLDIFELIEEVCAVPNMTAVPKVGAKALIVPFVIAIFSVMYILSFCVRLTRHKTYGRSPESRRILNTTRVHKSFATRLSSGFILALLFTFQKMGTTVFVLLNCVPIKEENVLFIDGTVTCYQYWQYGVMAYAICCVTPFFLVLMVGPGLLARQRIFLGEFFMACLFPLPALLIWACRRLWREAAEDRMRARPLPDDVTAVLEVLQGPFRTFSTGICWSGVLIGRRLVLVLAYTFINDTLIRLLIMLLSCFIILLHHVHVQPYRDMRGNIAGTTSAAALVTLGSINLVRAGFEAAGMSRQVKIKILQSWTFLFGPTVNLG